VLTDNCLRDRIALVVLQRANSFVVKAMRPNRSQFL
jgi:hypothetical protein